MAELKMEKKGDAEVAKITADIDALKAEAAQVRVLPLGHHTRRFENERSPASSPRVYPRPRP